MRDSARIDLILETIRRVWTQSPDLRLGQLLLNAVRPDEPCPALFYIEDSVLLHRLEESGEKHQPPAPPKSS